MANNAGIKDLNTNNRPSVVGETYNGIKNAGIVNSKTKWVYVYDKAYQRISDTPTGGTQANPEAASEHDGDTTLAFWDGSAVVLFRVIGGPAVSPWIKATVTKDLASVASGAAADVTFEVPGARAGAAVSVSPSAALTDGLIIAHAFVSDVDEVTVTFVNTTGSGIDNAEIDFYFAVFN